MAGETSKDSCAQPAQYTRLINEDKRGYNCDSDSLVTASTFQFTTNDDTAKEGKLYHASTVNKGGVSPNERRLLASTKSAPIKFGLDVKQLTRQRSASSSAIDKQIATKKMLNVWRQRASSSASLNSTTM